MIHQHRTDRATAYNHEKPHERCASFIKQSIYFANENIERLGSEIKMWGEPEIISLLGEDECYMKRCQAESALKEFQSEKQSWERLYEKLGACQTCAGSGWLWQCVSQDESIRVTCDTCGGKGKTLTAQASVAMTEAKTLAAKAEAEGTSKGNFLTMVARKFK